MGSVLLPSALQFVNTVDQLQSLLGQTQQQLSSGLAVSQASDAPDEVSPILQLHADIAQNSSIQGNLKSEQANAQTADQSLQSAGTIVNQIAALAAEGQGLDTTAATRQNLATQVTSYLQNLVNIANTTVDGSYIFSGDQAGSPTYQFNPATGTVTRLQVATATSQVQDGSGGAFPTSLTANQIFDARDSTDTPIAGQNIFQAISDIVTALNSNSTSGLQTALGNLQGASQYLDQQQSFYGGVETNISSALTTLGNKAVSLQTDLSNRQDADETKTIVEMQQYSTSLQAALASENEIPRKTLFDYMG